MKQLIVPGCIVLVALAAACDRIPLDPIHGDGAGGDATGEGGAGGSGSADSGSAGSGSVGSGSGGGDSGDSGSVGSGGSGSAGSGGSGSAGSGGSSGGAGDALWSRHLSANAGQPQLLGGSIAVDGAGHVVLATGIADGVDLGDGPLSTGGRLVFGLAKFDGEGDLLWHKEFSDFSNARDIAVNAAGRIATTGSVSGSSVDFGGGPLPGQEGWLDAFVAVFTASGDHVWSARIGADSDQYADSIAMDAAGNVVVTGFFQDQISLCGDTLTSAGLLDSYIARFDPEGHCLWSKQFGYTEIHNIALDAAGNVVLAGSVGSSITETIDLGGGPLTSAGGEDIFVAKLDAAGEHLWSERFGDAAHQRAYGVAIDGAGDVVLGGTFRGSVDFGGGPLVSAGGFDFLEPGSVTWGGNMFVTKLSSAGELVWAKRFGDEGPQTALDVATTVGGDIAITGLMYGDVDLGTGLLDCTYGDAFVAKLDAAGAVRWVRHTGDRGRQYGDSAAMDGAGSVFATGPFLGTIDVGTGPLVNPRNALDRFLVKLGP